MSGMLVALQTIGDATAIVTAVADAMRLASLAGREVTVDEVDAARNSAIAATQAAREAVERARLREQAAAPKP